MATNERFVATGLVGRGTASDGAERDLRLTKELGLVTSNLSGRFFEMAMRGMVFSQSSTPLGLAIPIYTGTALAGGMPIWNPTGSGVDVELISVSLGYGSGTADFGSIGVMVNSQIAAAPSAFADTTPKAGYVGGGVGSKVRSSNAGTVTVTAGTAAEWFRTLASMNLEAQTGTAHALSTATVNFEGSLVIPPGYIFYLAATKATVALIASTVVWAEHPQVS